MGAVRAINACRIAVRENGQLKVSLDQVIETMYRTGIDIRLGIKKPPLEGSH
jgi:L-serine dehydratase